jgi:putative transposase
MIRAYLYKLTPTRAQAAALSHLLDLHRWLYNAALLHRRLAWRYGRQSVSYAMQNRELTLIRQDDPRYGQQSSSAQQRTLRRLDAAFAAFFRRLRAGEKPGYPHPKRRREFDTVSFTAGNGARLTFDPAHRRSGRLWLHGIGTGIKTYVYRDPEGVAKQIAVTRRASGWWVSVTCQVAIPEAPPSTLPAVGLDLGLRAFAATSDGETIDPPRPYERGLKRLRRDQRRLARRVRGSRRRERARQQLAREAERVANRRREWQRKTAKSLSERYGLIAVEDLDVRRLVRNAGPQKYPWAAHALHRGIHDAAWASFLPILERRLSERGGQLVRVPPEDTTRRCADCGSVHDVSIFRRLARCPACGRVEDQDVRAARNLLGDPRTQQAREVLGRARLRAALRTLDVHPGRPA